MSGVQKSVDWSQYSLKNGIKEHTTERSKLKEERGEEPFYGVGEGEELFSKEEKSKPWWLINILVSERTLFGTWDGVFTSCMANLLGAIVFLRTGWVVAQAGIIQGALIVTTAVIVVASTTLSVVGILSLIQIESGGVYFLVSHVLGSRIGGSVGLVYCFGQIVGIAVCFVGFGESMNELLELDNMWIERGFAMAALLLLAVINFSGVRPVIKIQFVLFVVLVLSLIDFYIGSFVKHNKDDGVTGWSHNTWNNNLWSNYTSGYTWFSVLGVFFPSITGTMAGINMSSDLRSPDKDITIGTLSSLFTSLILYLLIVFVLGGTVKREYLGFDSLIMEKVSATGILLLLGLYTSTLSCPLVSLYGTPRVLQSLASEHVIPILRPLEMGRGPNKVPILSLLLTVIITTLFLLIGQINVLAPIVSAPFLIAYAAIDYAYFALAVTYQSDPSISKKDALLETSSSIRQDKASTSRADLDQLFPERITRKKVITKSTASSESSSPSEKPPSPVDNKLKQCSDSLKDDCIIGEGAEGENELTNISSFNIGKKSKPWFFFLSNKWFSLLGGILKIALMFAINWIYGLIGLIVVILLYFYIALMSPGVPPGIVSKDFNIFKYIKYRILILFGKSIAEYDEIIIPPAHPGVEVETSQLTKENLDFAQRSKIHQSKNYQN